LIEDAANGPAIFNALSGLVPGIIAVKPEEGKVAGASGATARRSWQRLAAESAAAWAGWFPSAP